MVGDVDVLKSIRRSYASAAARCSKGAKTVVQATSEAIAARRGRQSRLAKLISRFRRLT